MAIRANASTDSLRTSNNAPTGDFSISFWAKPESDRALSVTLCGFGGDTAGAADAICIFIAQATAGNPIEVWALDNAAARITGPNTSTGTWYHIALVGNTGAGQTLTLYVDGTSFAGTTGAGTYANGVVDLLVSSNDTSRWSDVYVTAYKHWNVQLTAAQIDHERYYYQLLYPTSVWSWSPMLNSGNTNDWSGAGNHFTGVSLLSDHGPRIFWGTARRRRSDISTSSSVTMVADEGTFALSGQATAFGIGEVASHGTYTLSGQDAAFGVGEVAGHGTYTHTGQAATLATAMTSAHGVYTVTGQDADLVDSGGSIITPTLLRTRRRRR